MFGWKKKITFSNEINRLNYLSESIEICKKEYPQKDTSKKIIDYYDVKRHLMDAYLNLNIRDLYNEKYRLTNELTYYEKFKSESYTGMLVVLGLCFTLTIYSANNVDKWTLGNALFILLMITVIPTFSYYLVRAREANNKTNAFYIFYYSMCLKIIDEVEQEMKEKQRQVEIEYQKAQEEVATTSTDRIEKFCDIASGIYEIFRLFSKKRK